MNGQECLRIDDAAGYVLSALTDFEAEAYAYHVAECADCAAKVAELSFVSHALLSAVPQLSAPPDIRNRVMSVVRAESELLLAAGAGADRPSARAQRRFGFGLGRLRPLTAGALATVLLAVGIGAGAVLSNGPDSSCMTTAAKTTTAGTKAKLEVCDGSARLALTGMQKPPEGQIYELWLDDPHDRAGAKPAGLFSVRNGKASVDVGRLKGHPRVLVTHELLPNGSSIPTTQPIVTAVT